MRYTKELTYEELKNRITNIANLYDFKIEYFLADDDFCEYDGKISTKIKVFSNKCQIEFYEYKQTSLYSNKLPKPSHFREKSYEWHVKCDDELILKVFQEILID